MARPTKQGLDYFSLDVVLDDKFDLIEAEFGLTGFGVVVKILQKIYGGQGYYIEWKKEVALLFAQKCGLGGNVVSEIVSAAVKLGIFDGYLFSRYQVLTSRGIQKRYFTAVGRRKGIDVESRYLLGSYAQNSENGSSNAVNEDNNAVNEDNNRQSKVNESKVKEIKYTTTTTGAPDFGEIYEYFRYESAIGGNYATEASKFMAYNAARGWDCMPLWREAADLWVERAKAIERR